MEGAWEGERVRGMMRVLKSLGQDQAHHHPFKGQGSLRRKEGRVSSSRHLLLSLSHGDIRCRREERQNSHFYLAQNQTLIQKPINKVTLNKKKTKVHTETTISSQWLFICPL